MKKSTINLFKIIGRLAIIIIPLSNIFWMFGGGLFYGGIGESYYYSTRERTIEISERPSKGKKLKHVKKGIKRRLESGQCTEEDCTVYRRFRRNWLKFWLWHDYIFHPRWWEFSYLPL